MLFRADDDRVYAYLRFETGDEMSRRKKFAFVTWIGPSVSPLKKAKVSTDKAFVKAICYVSLQCVRHSCTLDFSLLRPLITETLNGSLFSVYKLRYHLLPL